MSVFYAVIDSCASQPYLNKGVCIKDVITSSFKCCCPTGYINGS